MRRCVGTPLVPRQCPAFRISSRSSHVHLLHIPILCKMDSEALKAHYERYIGTLNAFQAGGSLDLSEFAADEVTYNGKRLSRAQYQDLITKDLSEAPDFHFNIVHLLAAGDHVASRLLIKGTPKGEFLGMQPTGKTVEFPEHVFYRFEGGKIKEVWSLIDKPGIAEQLRA